jgi:hypothetical protein
MTGNRRPPIRTVGRQRGWVGLVVILLALVIVAYLAKDALRAYLPSAATTEPARQGERTRLPPAAVDASGMTSPSTPSFQAPIERARGVEATVQQQADQARRQLDAQTR